MKWQISTHIAQRTNHNDDNTNKTTDDDKYSWQDTDDKRKNMREKEIIECKVNLTVSKLTKIKSKSVV